MPQVLATPTDQPHDLLADPRPSSSPEQAPAPDPRERIEPAQPQDQTGPGLSAADLAARHNAAAVTEAHAGLMESIDSILHGTGPDSIPGFLNLQGRDALNAHQGVQDTLGQMRKQLAGNLGNDTQRAMFDRVAAHTLDAAQRQADEHATAQLTQYEMDASRARATAAADFAVNAYNPKPGADNTLYWQSLAAQHNELEKQAARQGLDAEAKKQYIQHGPDGASGLVSTYTNVLTSLLGQDQVPGARTYFDHVQGELPEAMRGKLGANLADAEAQHQAQRIATQIKADAPDMGKQTDALATKLDSGEITDHVHAIALQKLRADHAQTLSQQSDNDKQVLNRVWDLKNHNPNAAATDLSAADYAYLKSRGLSDQANAILNGHPAQDDPVLFNDLHRLSQDDPVKFAQANLLADSGNLSRAHYDYLQKVQDAIVKQTPQEMEASKTVNDAVAAVQASLRGVGINPAHGGKSAASVAAFESSLRDQLIAAQQAKTGAPLGREELRGIALAYLGAHVQNSTGHFAPAGRGAGRQEGNAANPDIPSSRDIPPNPDIPEDQRNRIAEALQRAGMRASDDHIRKVYANARGAE